MDLDKKALALASILNNEKVSVKSIDLALGHVYESMAEISSMMDMYKNLEKKALKLKMERIIEKGEA